MACAGACSRRGLSARVTWPSWASSGASLGGCSAWGRQLPRSPAWHACESPCLVAQARQSTLALGIARYSSVIGSCVTSTAAGLHACKLSVVAVMTPLECMQVPGHAGQRGGGARRGAAAGPGGPAACAGAWRGRAAAQRGRAGAQPPGAPPWRAGEGQRRTGHSGQDFSCIASGTGCLAKHEFYV